MSELLNDVMVRLESLGYHVIPEDELPISLLVNIVTKEIMIECNIEEIPDELKPMAVDAISGRFLDQKHDMGQLDGFDFTSSISSISEGDISITYALGNSASASPEQMFKTFVKRLSKLDNKKLSAFRRLRW